VLFPVRFLLNPSIILTEIITYAILVTLILQLRTLIIQYNQLRRLFENFAA